MSEQLNEKTVLTAINYFVNFFKLTSATIQGYESQNHFLTIVGDMYQENRSSIYPSIESSKIYINSLLWGQFMDTIRANTTRHMAHECNEQKLADLNLSIATILVEYNNNIA